MRREGRGQLEERPRPMGRLVMLLIGLLVGVVLATAVAVFFLGVRLATVGQAERVIEAPTPTATPTSEETQAASGAGDVPESCVRSAEYNIAIDEALDDLALGARDEDARTIQEALSTIQNARDTADGAAQECLDLASGTGSP